MVEDRTKRHTGNGAEDQHQCCEAIPLLPVGLERGDIHQHEKRQHQTDGLSGFQNQRQ